MWKPNKKHNSVSYGPLALISLCTIHPPTFILSFSFLAFMVPQKGVTKIFQLWQIHKCENIIRDITLWVMGPWPLFYYHSLFSSGTKCGISFMEVGPETFKVSNKMWSHGITEFRNDGRTWQIQYSPTFSKQGYDREKKNVTIEIGINDGCKS